MGFKVWECMVCGFIYNEIEGCIEEGIAPGTRWEDIPDDWYCPDCGVAKREFVMQERSAFAAETLDKPLNNKPTVSESLSTTDTASISYKQWQCIVCGFIYNEAKGWPEEGIVAGTLWKDVPDDWLCPDCGVGKSDFSMMELSERAESVVPQNHSLDLSRKPIVIIGTGLAAYHTVREFRQHDQQTPVVMISEDDGSYYSKPLLSSALSAGQTPEELVSNYAHEMAKTLNIDIHIFSSVSNVDTEAKTVFFDGGVLEYSQLVFATGAKPKQLPLQGTAAHRVYTINNLQDYKRFRAAIVTKQTVLIMGAGLIGSEYANDLVQAGFNVHVVEPANSVLANLLPGPASKAVQRSLESAGVNYYLGVTVNVIDQADNGGITVRLSNGHTVFVEAVLSATGVSPNIGLAQQAGLKTNIGLVVDSQLRTSAADVYAIGDCAEVNGHIKFYIAPLMHCASVLAHVLAAKNSNVNYGHMPIVIKTPLCPVVLCLPNDIEGGHWVCDESGKNISARFIQNEQLKGFALTGTSVGEKNLWLKKLQ